MESYHVPVAWTQPVTPHLVAMKGTDQVKPHCQALEGIVGKFVSCRIYDQRSSTCRNFKPSFEEGAHSPICDEARAKCGMKPLSKEDWKAVSSHS